MSDTSHYDAESLRVAASYYGPASAVNPVLQWAADEIERLQLLLSEGKFQLTERTAETLDAERYRYLRNAAGQYLDDTDGPSVCSGTSDLFEYHVGPEVDEVVDAAMARWKAAGCPMPEERASVAHLAATQCPHAYGDDHGHQGCKEIDRLADYAGKLRAVLERIAAYPRSPEDELSAYSCRNMAADVLETTTPPTGESHASGALTPLLQERVVSTPPIPNADVTLLNQAITKADVLLQAMDIGLVDWIDPTGTYFTFSATDLEEDGHTSAKLLALVERFRTPDVSLTELCPPAYEDETEVLLQRIYNSDATSRQAGEEIRTALRAAWRAGVTRTGLQPEVKP